MTEREKLVKLVHTAIAEWEHGEVDEKIADHLISNGATFQKWIPVTERLPDKQHDWVFVACKLTPENWYGVPHIAELRKGVWWADCYDMPLTDAGVVVTHWMPLPEPPKENDNE